MIDIILQNSNFLELLLFLLVGIFLLPKYLNDNDRNMNVYTFAIFLSFFIIFFHSLIFSWEPLKSSIDSLLAILKLTILFLFTKLISPKNISKLMGAFFILLSFIAIIPGNLILIFGQINNFSNDGNFHSIFANANMYGMYLALFVTPFIFSLPDRLYSKNNLKQYLSYFLLINIFYLLLMTGSRINLAIFIICSMFSYLNMKDNRWNYKYFLKIISIFLIVVSTFFTFFNEYFLSLIFKGQLSIFTTRIPLWLSRIEAISEKPFIGWGYNVNEFYFFDKYNVFNELEKGNTILAIIEEFGILLGVFLIIAFAKVFFEAFKKYNKNVQNRYLGIIILLIPLHLLIETWLLNFNSIFAIFTWFIVINALENYNEI